VPQCAADRRSWQNAKKTAKKNPSAEEWPQRLLALLMSCTLRDHESVTQSLPPMNFSCPTLLSLIECAALCEKMVHMRTWPKSRNEVVMLLVAVLDSRARRR
jgi:hypothetical protein